MTAKLHVSSDEQSLAVVGADIVCHVVRAIPNAVVTFATGQSAMPIYRELAERVGRGEIAFLACVSSSSTATSVSRSTIDGRSSHGSCATSSFPFTFPRAP